MPRYRRSIAPGATYFFTVNSYQRCPILTHPDVRIALRHAIETVRKTMPFTIEAWVLLPDHLHAIWTLPPGDAAFGKRWGIIKTVVSKKCAALINSETARSSSRIRRHENDFWQRRFWEHQIRDDDDYERHVDYVHFNPVKHGHVQRVTDWEYSTFHRYVKRGLYPDAWGVDPGRIGGQDE